MSNEWDNLFNGVVQGGAGLAQGLIQHQQNNNISHYNNGIS